MVSGSDSFVSILRGGRPVPGSMRRMFFHSRTRSAGIGRPPLRLKPSSGPKIGTPPRPMTLVVDDVEGPDDAVGEPVGRDGELDRHERPAVLVRGLVVPHVEHRWLAGDFLVHRARSGRRSPSPTNRGRKSWMTAHW